MSTLWSVVTQSRVVEVREHFRREWVSGVGPDTVFQNISLGWFILMEGSHEAVHAGSDKPTVKIGARIRITLQEEP